MNKLKPKNKIIFQSKNLIWNNLKFLNLKKRKWSRVLNAIKDNRYKESRPKSLKKLYKSKLLAKQSLKQFYGCLTESQLKKIFISYKSNVHKTEQICALLEQRLDVILFRLNIISSILEVKQLINHKKIYVNNKIVNSPNYGLQPGDYIYINEEYIKFQNNLKVIKVPAYLEFNKNLNIIFLYKIPEINEIDYPFETNIQLILDFYTK